MIEREIKDSDGMGNAADECRNQAKEFVVADIETNQVYRLIEEYRLDFSIERVAGEIYYLDSCWKHV